MKHTVESIRATIPVGIALACLAIQPTAQAESRPAKTSLTPSEHVTYADLDLTASSR